MLSKQPNIFVLNIDKPIKWVLNYKKKNQTKHIFIFIQELYIQNDNFW